MPSSTNTRFDGFRLTSFFLAASPRACSTKEPAPVSEASTVRIRFRTEKRTCRSSERSTEPKSEEETKRMRRKEKGFVPIAQRNSSLITKTTIRSTTSTLSEMSSHT